MLDTQRALEEAAKKQLIEQIKREKTVRATQVYRSDLPLNCLCVP